MGKYTSFRLGNETYAYSSLPMFPVYRIDRELTEEDWQQAFPMEAFRYRFTDNLGDAAKFCAKFILSEDRLHFRLHCTHGASEPLEMYEKYEGWCFDNAVELFFGFGESYYQFELNGVGARMLMNLRTGKLCDMDDCFLKAENKPGYWQVDFSIPAKKFMPDGEAAFHISCNDVSSILGSQYYDAVNNKDTWDFGLLKEMPAGTMPDAGYLLENTKPADYEFLKKMALSVYANCGLEIPQNIDSVEKILGIAHDAVKKIKPVRQEAGEVHLANCIGKMRRFHGINFGPHIAHQGNRDMNESYKALGVVSARTHDAVLTNPGCRIVDTIFVFPLEHLDPSKPENYYFDQTDYYFKNTMDQGAEMYYRLGVSIDHEKQRFTAKAPKDYNHFAEVCAGIVRHYNRGWASGFHWNIKYWEIWNEAEYVSMWDKSYEEYIKMFVIVLKRLKAEFPEIKVGGPAAVGLNIPTFRAIAEKCNEAGVQPDFFSWHIYSSNMEGMALQPFAARAITDAIGYKDAEIHLTEWHYVNKGPGSPEGAYDMGAGDSAAYTAGVLAAWQNSPMDLEHFYDAGSGSYGIYDSYWKPKAVYYALTSFGRYMREFTEQVETRQGPLGTRLIAAGNGKGQYLMLYTCLKTKEMLVKLRIKGLGENTRLKVSILDDKHNLADADYVREGEVLVLKKELPSALFVIETLAD